MCVERVGCLVKLAFWGCTVLSDIILLLHSFTLLQAVGMIHDDVARLKGMKFKKSRGSGKETVRYADVFVNNNSLNSLEELM